MVLYLSAYSVKQDKTKELPGTVVPEESFEWNAINKISKQILVYLHIGRISRKVILEYICIRYKYKLECY